MGRQHPRANGDNSILEAMPGGADQTRPPASVQIEGFSQEYAGSIAVNNVDLTVQAGELLTLLGASGSGKSTILHALAGLHQPTRGRILIDDVDVTDLPPQRRNVGLVFQSYALFPHMTAAQNIRFPLEVQNEEPSRMRQRVEEILSLVGLSTMGDRFPNQLSGGQQQRVAIGRALAPLPRVLLLDEPLGALDKRLRQQLSRQIRELQQRTGVTTIYVTHDQEEAFVISDRIAIMDRGRIRQLGTPKEIYENPRELFVAQFVGELNSFHATILEQSNAAVQVQVEGGSQATIATDEIWRPNEHVTCIVRPEWMNLWKVGESTPASVHKIGSAKVIDSIYLGSEREVTLQWRDRKISSRIHPALDVIRNASDVCFGWTIGHESVIRA
jgi:ABC-type Fe3+/spermidine/putrescine transport system ATPase subunit